MKNIMKNKIKNNLLIAIILVSVVVLAGCISSSENSSGNGIAATVYKEATCGCCGNYAFEMGIAGFEVESMNVQNLAIVKQKYNIPTNMQSCHTTIVGDYFVEGHMPFEAITKLLEEQPDIDGIALPDMPAGSIGMPGLKAGPFTIYALKDGVSSVFMTI